MFAALADDDTCSVRSSSSSSSSNALARDFANGVAVATEDASSSSSSSDDDDVDDQAHDDVWRWSTGRTTSTLPSQSRAPRATKLLKGEKKRLKALHVAETRARRAARAPDGFVASDARERMESVVRTGRALTIACSARGHVAKAQGRVICAISRALRAEARERRRGKRLVFDVERIDNVSQVPVEGDRAWDELERVCAMPMTREEYLKSDERRERVAKVASAARGTPKSKPKKSRGRMWNTKDDDETGRVRTSRTSSTRVMMPERVAFERAGSHEDDIRASTAAAPRATSAVVSDDFGAFEQHTRGIGARLLAKMGFRRPGQGLGASSQGIAEVPTTEARTKRAGLGA
jgi:hypothetical protein